MTGRTVIAVAHREYCYERDDIPHVEPFYEIEKIENVTDPRVLADYMEIKATRIFNDMLDYYGANANLSVLKRDYCFFAIEVNFIEYFDGNLVLSGPEKTEDSIKHLVFNKYEEMKKTDETRNSILESAEYKYYRHLHEKFKEI